MIKVAPINKYPYINTQNQIYERDSFSQISVPDFLYLFYGIEEDDYFDNYAEVIHSHYGLGSLNWTFRFNKDYFSIEQNMLRINFFIILEVETNKKYYYFVENVRQINEKVYEYDLALDVIKTYFYDIMTGFTNIRPLRYFQKIDEYFDYRKYGNKDILDPLIPYPQNATLKIPLVNYFENITSNQKRYSFTGLWSYLYLTYASNAPEEMTGYTSFKNEDFYIVAIPKNNPPLSNEAIIKSRLLKSPYLLKVVDSPFHPFDLSKIYNDDVFSKLEITYDKSTDMTITNIVSDVLTRRSVYDNSNHLDVFNYDVNNTFLPKSLRDVVGSFDTDNRPYIFLVRDNHRNEISMRPLDKTLNDVNFIDMPENPEISLSGLKEELKNGITKNIAHLFIPYELGFLNDNKMLINLNSLRYGSSYLRFSFFGNIIHSLASTDEVLSFDNVVDKEYRVKRSKELNYSKVNDEYFNYVYLNQNALIQKGEQLNKWNDVNTLTSSVVGVASSVGVAMATGGVGLPLAIGAGVSSYNMLKNLFNNEMLRKAHEAQLKDKSLTPLKFDIGNYNSNDNVLSYLPYLISYRNSNTISNDYNFFDTYGINNEIMNVIKDYGFYTPLDDKEQIFYDYQNIRDLMTREHYNYIQLRDTEKIVYWYGNSLETVGDIPNEHIKLIFQILENGVRFYSTDYVRSEEHDFPNNEIGG